VARRNDGSKKAERAPLDALVLPGLPTQRSAPPASRLAYNIANFLPTLALPKEIEQLSLTTLREKLVKIGTRIVRHGRYVVFQLAEVAVPRVLFAKILPRIDGLRLRSPPFPT
jgi:Transposase DDE domain group 1